MYAGTNVEGGLGGVIVVKYLAMRLWPFIHIALVLYMCNSGALYVLPLYGCGNCDPTSVLYGITWGSI